MVTNFVNAYVLFSANDNTCSESGSGFVHISFTNEVKEKKKKITDEFRIQQTNLINPNRIIYLWFWIILTWFLGVRNPKEAQKNIESRVDFSELNGVKIYYEYLDTGNLKSVRQFAKSVQQKFAKIDILINNAGIMATPYYLTEDGYESQFAVNYLGHFLLTHLLMPQLRAAGTQDLNSRIVNVSSCANIVGTINMDDINGT